MQTSNRPVAAQNLPTPFRAAVAALQPRMKAFVLHRAWLGAAAVALGACALTPSGSSSPAPMAAAAPARSDAVPASPCVADDEVARLEAAWLAREALTALPANLNMPAAACGRDRLVRRLTTSIGPIVGYKAGLTSAAVQQRFHHDAPLRGTLLRGMILPNTAVVPAAFGARPVFEADLVAVVADEGINEARTPEQVVAHLSAIHPFIELPDLVVADPAGLNGPALQLVNVGARLGVLGNAMPTAIQSPQAWVRSLQDMRVRLIDGDGATLDEGRGSAILGNPLNAVLWLAQDLKAGGASLKAGDLLSLGSFTRLLPPRAGQTVRAVYEGLPGNPDVVVHFR